MHTHIHTDRTHIDIPVYMMSQLKCHAFKQCVFVCQIMDCLSISLASSLLANIQIFIYNMCVSVRQSYLL